MPIEALRAALAWNCSDEQMREWLIQSGQGKLLHPPTTDAQMIDSVEALRQHIRSLEKQKDTLVSVEGFYEPSGNR